MLPAGVLSGLVSVVPAEVTGGVGVGVEVHPPFRKWRQRAEKPVLLIFPSSSFPKV